MLKVRQHDDQVGHLEDRYRTIQRTKRRTMDCKMIPNIVFVLSIALIQSNRGKTTKITGKNIVNQPKWSKNK